jgi:hypothetical protein
MLLCIRPPKPEGTIYCIIINHINEKANNPPKQKLQQFI